MCPTMLMALFFDLDGTLVDSERHHWRAWHAALLPLNVRLSWQLYRDEGIGYPDPEILRRLARVMSNASLADQVGLLRVKEQHFIRLVQEASPVSRDIVALVQEMAAYPLAVVTSSPRAEAAAILQGAGVAQHFTTVVCLDDVRKPKPDPEPYLVAMKRLRVKRGIAFEDSKSGMASARAAGLQVVGVSRPTDLPALVRSTLSLESSGSIN